MFWPAEFETEDPDEIRTFLDAITGLYFLSTIREIRKRFDHGICWIDREYYKFVTDDGFTCYVVELFL